MRWAFAVVLLLSMGAPAPAAAVADDAHLAFLSLSAWTGFEDDPRPGLLRAQLEATDDAPAGPIAGQVVFTVQDLGGVQPAQRIVANFTADVPEGTARRGFWKNVEANWTAERGLYNVTAELWTDGADHPWDSWWTWHAAGRLPRLGEGWGHVAFPAAPSFDLDGDGADDVWLADNATGRPLARSLDAYDAVRMGTDLESWSQACGRSLELDLGGEGAPVTDVRVSTAAVEALAPGGSPLRMDTQSSGGAPPPPVNGSYGFTLGARFFGTRSDGVFFQRTCAPPVREPNTWGDGYRTVANVTHWDLDGDGAMDVRFWGTNATTVEGAHSEAVADRRSEELVLIAEARVERRTTLNRLTFEMRRPDDRHEGAWVEIQDADRLFHSLLKPPENTTLAYTLSLPSNESFVEQDGNTTWAWIGHFSTQTLTAEYVKTGSVTVTDTISPQPETETRDAKRAFPIPAAPAALLALALAAFALTRRRL